MNGAQRRGFFFEQKAGIRDYKVTGVQTCALRISVEAAAESFRGRRAPRGEVFGGCLDSASRLFASRESNHADHVFGVGGGIGRAAWRGRGEISGGGGSFKKKKKNP